MTMRMTVAGRSISYQASGDELPARREASLSLDMRQLDPSLGEMRMLLIGDTEYVQFGALTALLPRTHGSSPGSSSS